MMRCYDNACFKLPATLVPHIEAVEPWAARQVTEVLKEQFKRLARMSYPTTREIAAQTVLYRELQERKHAGRKPKKTEEKRPCTRPNARTAA